MRILFIGTVELSQLILNKLIDLKEDVVGVVTRKSSNFNSDFVDLSDLCIENNIPVNYVNSINTESSILWIKNRNPQIIFCIGWSELLSEEILDLPELGVIGFHPALLPQNRGRHPIVWALVLGLKKTGSTFFFMDKYADHGDIISQEEIHIDHDDNARTLYDKISRTALKQIEVIVRQLNTNTLKRYSQKGKKTNTWRKRNARDGLIDFRMSSIAIYNLVRALTKPYIGAHLVYKGQEIKIWKVHINKKIKKIDNIEYGKILKIDKDKNIITVKCYDGAVDLVEHDFKILPKEGEYII